MLVVLCRVLTRCNLACGFCAHDRRLPGARPALDPALLSHGVQLLGDWRVHTGREVLLSWLGGEPLWWRERLPLDAQARAAGLRLSLTTNGSTLDRAATRAQLLRDYSELTVSLDAPAGQHDALRGSVGTWARAVEGLRCLLLERRRTGAPLTLRINSVLMRSTIAGYASLLTELLQALPGIDEFSFNLLGGRDRPEFHAAEAVAPAQWQSFVAALPALRAQVAGHGARLLGGATYVARLQAQVDTDGWPVDDCAPGRDFLFLDEYGRLAPCAFTGATYGVPLRALDSWRDLCDLPARFARQRSADRATVCSHCPSTQIAGKFSTHGVCAAATVRRAEERMA